MPTVICYLRKGRHVRATGTVLDPFGPKGTVKVKPSRDDWKAVWLTRDEIDAGREKPPIRPRGKKETPQDEKPKPRVRRPKPEPRPLWKLLVADVRTLEADHHPEGWPAVKMRTLSDLADELEKAHAKLAEFLPLNVQADLPATVDSASGKNVLAG